MSDRRESDRLLELAERQFERVTKLRNVLFFWRLGMGWMALTAVYWGSKISWHAEIQSAWEVLQVVFVVLGAVFVGVTLLGLRSAQQSLRIEEPVLNEALSLVQESEKYFADKEQWTLLERAEFRLRLRRLPVGVAPPPASATASPTPTPSPTRPPTAV